ncbi:hypothetical protein VTO42DRAFT_6660 [Malbranchea cinnamomea]
MPSPLPSSFASAAAGNTQDSSSGPRRGEMGSGEWTRHRMNGATQTFRRPSVTTNPSHTRESTSASSTPTSGAYIPPHLSSNYQPGSARSGSGNESRYSKEQLLDVFKNQRDFGDVAEYLLGDWNHRDETSTTNGSWGKRGDFKDYHAGPEVCWDPTGQARPLALTDMTEEEKTLFSTSVNSPLKPPPQAGSKDNSGAGGANRKTSVSQPHLNSFNSSPSSARPNPRRRGTGDSAGNTMSPTPNSRFFRDESNTATPPPSLLRRKTDFRDPSETKLEDKEKDRDASLDLTSPYGTLKRSVTMGVTQSGSSSPWAATSPSQNSGFASMGGAFGSFSLGPITPGGSGDKRPGFGSLRGESRFKSLLSKGSSEDIGSSGKEKPSSGLDSVPESADNPSRSGIQTRTSRSDTNPFDEPRGGSSAFEGVSTPSTGIDQFGLSAFGLPSTTAGSSGLMSVSQQPSSRPEPMSPTNTNPYQSPHGEKIAEPEDIDTDGSEIQTVHLPNLSELQEDTGNATFSSIQTGVAVEGPAGDRSQTSSVAGNRGFPSLGGLGGLSSQSSSGGWPSTVSAAGGTPTRERSAFSGFGDPIFGSMADLQSPSLSTLGGGGSFFGSHSGFPGSASGSARPSKLGSLFPQAVQDQMRGEQARQDVSSENVPKSQAPSSPEKIATSNPPVTSAISQAPPPSTTAPGQNPTPTSQSNTESTSQAVESTNQSSSTSGQPPVTQQRQMVMPDRMRWIYRDPQGNTQGPWSGLEMHDWFKAGFFTADLQVKKLEDPEFEPLAQLVRRIGNSREPFLVPQIGIPHGPPSQGPWNTTPGPNGGVQPPFPTSFPSFGTTLTAEQQNALERRKQEEQYLMARQKEHLAQQQALMKQMQYQAAAVAAPLHPHPLQHHPSAHSLHSQPSYGTIASPGGFQPPPLQAPIQPPQPQTMPGFFEPPLRQNTVPNLAPQIHQPTPVGGADGLPALMDRLNIGRPQFPFGSAEEALHSQQVAAMLQDRARLQQEQEEFNRSKQADSIFDQQAREERLRQFHALRGISDENLNIRRIDGLPTHPTGVQPANEQVQQQQQHQQQQQQQQQQQKQQDKLADQQNSQGQQDAEQPLSLSQQVQKAASQRQQQQLQDSANQGESASKADNGLPQPFPPPPSASPLPAPAAQRNRQNVADALAAGSRSQTQTPAEVVTTSIAPWAKDLSEAPKGPSLKEIQEAEARQAAKLEEAAAAARRALAEQERANQPPPQVPGLPSTANWASASSTATTPGSAWGKAGAKGQPGSIPSAPKKTLAQIQKEEEARKQRQQAAAATANAQAAAANTGVNSVGKRYADLASKITQPTTASSGGAWTTVGAGGKPKPAPPAPVVQRSVTSTTPVTSAAKPRPAATTPRSTTASTTTTTTTTSPNKATEELAKWAKMTLGRGLNSSINVDDFVQQLLLLPAETEIISDSVYANSQTLDGRRFAEEFVRRRKLADKGIIDPAIVNVGAFGGYDQKSASEGWNEVAKKGQSNAHRDEANNNAAFKVVPPKKKGKR